MRIGLGIGITFNGGSVGLPFVYRDVNHVLVTGQSLALGLFSEAETITQPYTNLMFVTGLIAYNTGLTSFVPLIEGEVPGGTGEDSETPWSAMTSLTSQAAQGGALAAYPVGQRFHHQLVSDHAYAGAAYSGIKKGTSIFTFAMNQVTAGLSVSTGLGSSYVVRAVCVIHGEQDEAASSTTYEADLTEWQYDYETDARVISLQAEAIPMLHSQLSSWTKLGHTTSTVAMAQLAAHVNSGGKNVLVCPKYFIPTTDGIHLTTEGFQWIGEYYSKAYRRIIFEGQRWEPLRPTSCIIYGAVITVTFNVPVGPLVLDTVLVTNPGNYGFQYSDANSVSIVSVALDAANDSVIITLTRPPTVVGPRVKYAYTAADGVDAGPTTGARGCLRDSDATTSRFAYDLSNWCVHFNEELTDARAEELPYLVGDFLVPPPVLDSLSVTQGAEGGGTALSLVGTGFVTGATVTIGGVAATSVVVVSATSITCLSPAGTVGVQSIVVTNPDTQSATIVSGYTYLPGPLLANERLLWLRSDIGVTVDTGDVVSSWVDYSGQNDSARNVTAATTARPGYTAANAEYNNRPTIDFDGNPQRLLSGTWDAATSQPFTMVIVGRSNTSASGRYWFASLTEGALIREHEAFGMAAYAGTNLIGAASDGPATLLVEFNGATGKIYNNSRTATVSGTIGSAGLTGIRLGNALTDDSHLNGEIAEVIVLDGTLSPADLITLFDYLDDRYVSTFLPQSANLTGYFLASYAGSPWVGTASAGTSGTNDATEATNPPSIGATVNGYAPADFDGVNDRLMLDGDADAYFGATAVYGWYLAYFDADDLNIMSIGGVLYWYNESGSFYMELEPGERAGRTAAVGGWRLFTYSYDGTTAKVGVNEAPGAAGGASSIAYSDSLVLTSQPELGGFSFKFNGKILAAGYANTDPGALFWASLKVYYNALFGLSL